MAFDLGEVSEVSIVRTLTIARKELFHIVRDRRTLAVMFLIPIVQLFLLGYAATTDIEHLLTAVVDADRTPQSRELVEAFCDVFALPHPLVRLPAWAGALIAVTAEAAFALVGKEPPLSRRTLEFFEVDNAFDTSRARALLDWSPRTSLREGLEAMRPWLESLEKGRRA